MKENSALKPTVYGVGINDADYNVTNNNGSSQTSMCPFYKKWKSMLARCYSQKYLKMYPSYEGASVCNEWLVFSNFKRWMEKQDWEDSVLDKDILKGSREYNENSCVFVTQLVNSFILDRSRDRGGYPIGVHLSKGRYSAQCSNPFTKKRESLGFFDTPEEAHLAWKSRKHELACQLADSEFVTDERVKVALRNRYKPVDITI